MTAVAIQKGGEDLWIFTAFLRRGAEQIRPAPALKLGFFLSTVLLCSS